MDLRPSIFVLVVACGAPSADAPASPPAETPAPTASAPHAASPWITRHATEGATPEGAIKLWLEAAIAYSDPTRKAQAAAALAYLTIPFKDDPEWASRPTNQTFMERLADQPHLFRSYAVGATPENGYAMDPADWTLNVDRVEPPIDDRGTRVFLVSGGADSPRPVYVKQSEQTGLWYLANWANTYVGIRPIVDPTKETFK